MKLSNYRLEIPHVVDVGIINGDFEAVNGNLQNCAAHS